MSNRETRGWAVLTVSGAELHPEDVSRILGMEPDRIIPRDAWGRGIWQLNSRPAGNEKIEEHVKDLLRRLLPVRRNLRQLAREHEVRVSCVLDAGSETEAHFELDPRYLLLAGAVGAVMEFRFQAGFQ
ncbi:MAG: DUF4279 domain-containing protein [Leptospiraceae bacterium]|nr:DUF4279 domain-containing protein [Leptospiraceae bacterium]